MGDRLYTTEEAAYGKAAQDRTINQAKEKAQLNPYPGAEQGHVQGTATDPPPAIPSLDRQDLGVRWPRPTEELSLDNIDEAMQYAPWDSEQQQIGAIVREALTAAAKAILRHVPRSPRRTLALQHIVSARMDANTAITFRGRF